MLPGIKLEVGPEPPVGHILPLGQSLGISQTPGWAMKTEDREVHGQDVSPTAAITMFSEF